MGSALGAPPAKGAANRGDDGGEAEKDDDGRLLNRETGNIWGYVRPKDDPYA